MKKPIIKNSILIGIPTIISCLGILSATDELKAYNKLLALITFLLLIVFIGFLIYYSKNEENTNKALDNISKELEKAKSKFYSVKTLLNTNVKIIVSIISLTANWTRNINKLAQEINSKGIADEKYWDYEKICNDICICCNDSIKEFTGIKGDNVSVSLIRYYTRKNIEYVKMIANSSTETAKSDVFDKEELLETCQYQYAKVIKDHTRDAFILENKDKINKYFHKKSPETNLDKYNQYIAIPIICSENKTLGVLQIITRYDNTIMNSESELKDFIESYVTPYINLLILSDKIKKGLFSKPNK